MTQKRWYLRALSLALILTLAVLPVTGEDAGLSIRGPEEDVRPGRSVPVAFTLPRESRVDITAETPDGEVLATIARDAQGMEGTNYVWWDGTDGEAPLAAGDAVLRLRAGDETASADIRIGAPAPFIYRVTVDRFELTPEEPALRVAGLLSEPGVIRAELVLVTDTEQFVLTGTELEAEELDLMITADDALGEVLAGGNYRLELVLAADGEESDVVTVTFSVSGFDGADRAAGELLTEEEIPPEAADDTVDEGEPTGIPPESEELILDDLEPGDESGTPAGDSGETEAPAAASGTLPGEGEIFHLRDNDQSQYTPSYSSPYPVESGEVSYWNTPMDITDEEAVWNMLMSPITVVDNGRSNAQRTQVTIRREPDADAEGVGVVTCISQGVRVLETRGDWALIECYSASFHDSAVKAWNMLVQGWIPASYLRTVTPDPNMGIVVDKLTQRLYIFRDGHLYDTLLVSTGKVNARQPYNETRAGEFLLMVPSVGGFRDGNMICSMAIRFNGGDLLHEVPHSENSAGEKYYGTYEPALGTKASHGCIRVQRRRTPLGTNMAWIWKNRRNNTRIVIWEDWQGRQILPPSDDTPLYYNPRGGKMYHSCETCYSASGRTFTAFTYGELEDEAYRRLTRCPWCSPPLRLREIAEINRTYIPGGDHEPVLTEARIKQGFLVEGTE